MYVEKLMTRMPCVAGLAVVVVVDGRDDVSLLTRFRHRVLEITQWLLYHKQFIQLNKEIPTLFEY